MSGVKPKTILEGLDPEAVLYIAESVTNKYKKINVEK